MGRINQIYESMVGTHKLLLGDLFLKMCLAQQGERDLKSKAKPKTVDIWDAQRIDRRGAYIVPHLPTRRGGQLLTPEILLKGSAFFSQTQFL